jgi:hypothetical protein
MLLTALTMMLAAADVQTTAEQADVQPKWAVNYALTSPSVIGASFSLTPAAQSGLGGLGSVTRPVFTNTLSLERALGEHLTGLVALTFGYSQFSASVSSVSGGGLLGVHWYQSRPLEGFWAGPEVLFQLTTLQVPGGLGGAGSQTQAVGLRGRAGWTQRFGAHFLVSASAGVGANLDWTSGSFAQTTLNLAVDGALGAGLMF